MTKKSFVAPTFIAKRFFPVGDFDDLTAYGMGGAGLFFDSIDGGKRGGGGGFDFMLHLGAGIDYRIEDEITVGTAMVYTILPGGGGSYSTWQFLTVAFMW